MVNNLINNVKKYLLKLQLALNFTKKNVQMFLPNFPKYTDYRSRSCNSSIFCISVGCTCFFRYPQKKKSRGFRTGHRGGQHTGLPRSRLLHGHVVFFLNFLFLPFTSKRLYAILHTQHYFKRYWEAYKRRVISLNIYWNYRT